MMISLDNITKSKQSRAAIDERTKMNIPIASKQNGRTARANGKRASI